MTLTSSAVPCPAKCPRTCANCSPTPTRVTLSRRWPLAPNSALTTSTMPSGTGSGTGPSPMTSSPGSVAASPRTSARPRLRSPTAACAMVAAAPPSATAHSACRVTPGGLVPPGLTPSLQTARSRRRSWPRTAPACSWIATGWSAASPGPRSPPLRWSAVFRALRLMGSLRRGHGRLLLPWPPRPAVHLPGGLPPPAGRSAPGRGLVGQRL